MAIREFSPEGTQGTRRAKIAFLGYMPAAEDLRQFELRRFKCEEWTLEQLRQSEKLAELDALIWTQRSDKPNELPRQLRSVVPSLLDHDVRVYIRLAEGKDGTDTARRLVVNALGEGRIPPANLYPEEWRGLPVDLQERQGGNLMPNVFIFEANDAWPGIATIVCDHPAGPVPKFKLSSNAAILDGRFDSGSHEERVLLLQRAFWNCSELRLRLIAGGLSGAQACQAYASLEAGITGAYHHLYFVKIGPRKKIVDEYDKYCSHVLEYVPFYLAPRLRLERCNLGSSQGILVGDFVEGTESLISCARDGRCGPAISNLFDKTLGAWRKRPVPDPSSRTLSTFLEEKWKVEGSREMITVPSVRESIVKALGGALEIPPLKRAFEKYGNTVARCGPAHGDMHATNVLVRHGDAILIDFEKMKPIYPLTYDPASLEGGMLVEGFMKDLEQLRLAPEKLVELLDPVYALDTLLGRAEISCERGDVAEWYFDAVNQIRTHSWSAENEPGQYALTLALCLIRKGCNAHDDFTEQQNVLRGIAFFFGQRILREVVSRRGLKVKRKVAKKGTQQGPA